MHEIISDRAMLPGSTTTRFYNVSAMKDSFKSQSGCDKLSGCSVSRLLKEILGTGDKANCCADTFNMPTSYQ